MGLNNMSNTKKIKILYEGLSGNLGGIETFVYNLCNNIDKDKFEVSIMLDKNVQFPLKQELEKQGCKFFYITNRKTNYLKYLQDLKQLYTNNKFDIIHINIMSYSVYERITYACKYSHAKVIVHSHNAGYKRGYYRTRFLHKIGKWKIKNCSFIKVACGEEAGKYMFGKDKFIVFNNGIDYNRFRFSLKNRKTIRKELNIKENEICLGLVAIFSPVKNHTFLIDVIYELNKLNENIKLILIGVGILEDSIKKKVEELDLTDKVIFLGKKVDANKYYSAMDIYIMPSISEGLSIALCEAQVNGLKCYTSDGVDKQSNISGNVEFLSLEKTPKEWAEHILKSNNSRDENVLKKIPEKFDAKKSYNKIYKFYEDILK